MQTVVLCPGQGAQVVGMAKSWCEANADARAIFETADRLYTSGPDGRTLSDLAWNGPAELLSRTDVSQAALYTAAIACAHAMGMNAFGTIVATAGLSLGEYTALHLAGAFSFEDGLRLVIERGRLMQSAAEMSKGGMVALIGADEASAQAVCDEAAQGEVLVPANYNAPGQIVLSGHASACARAATVASEKGLRAAVLSVAGAFHSPLMQPAAEGMERALAQTQFSPLHREVWSNVTAQPHNSADLDSIRKRLVEQLVSPVRWSQSCANLIASLAARQLREGTIFHELAPGTVLRGLMKRIDRATEVTSHDQPA
ncbi:MAG: ACP S-malonyltransferase [Phycisphaerales bacterium]|nr:ACP S-malonyltransferase [Phycisphaerales bacterium]